MGADDGFTGDEIADDRVIAERLAPQRPYWRPGPAFGYHAVVIGALTGEVVGRVTGRSIQEHFEERVRKPFGPGFYLELPEELEPRFRTTQPEKLAADATRPDSLTGIAFNRNHPEAPEPWELPNIKLVRQLSPASVGGVASVRGLAGMDRLPGRSGSGERPPGPRGRDGLAVHTGHSGPDRRPDGHGPYPK